MSQSKQVLWVFTANVDERALTGVQHPSLSKKGNTEVSATEGGRVPLGRRDAGMADSKDAPTGCCAGGQGLVLASKESGRALLPQVLQLIGLSQLL